MKIKHAIFANRAPFENLTLDFDDKNITVLSGINGSGKTTILSHITDALYEMARGTFFVEFEDKHNKYYRVSSPIFSMEQDMPSLVYLRFIDDEGKNVDYIDVRKKPAKEFYENLIQLDNPIPYSTLESKFKEGVNSLKYFSVKKDKTEDLFKNNVLTYFPSYRYEKPNYLNTPYDISMNFNIDSSFAGYLPNPIEVVSDLNCIANWIMDVVLDSELYKNNSLLRQINTIVNGILSLKESGDVRIGIGERHSGGTRIQIIKQNNMQTVYPSIFSMSSGEHSLLCIFMELLKQADKIGKTCENVSGIVLIDEIDKHLHIKAQKDLLPNLIKLFPNIQFIFTTHSPFIHFGLCENNELKYQIFDLSVNGFVNELECNPLFGEVYEIISDESDKLLNMYNDIKNRIKDDTKPIIITEGKTDWKHLKKAKTVLGIKDDVDFYEVEEDMGDTNLMNLLKNLSRIRQGHKIIGIFDRDNDKILNDIGLENSNYKDFGNNVYGFAIPCVHEQVYGEYTSIEHYYSEEDLFKKDKNHRRLFLGSEFYESSMSKNGEFATRCKNIQNKVKVNGVIDEKVYELKNDLKYEHSVALSKNDYAELILNDKDFSNQIDFSEFSKIFDVISEIIKTN